MSADKVLETNRNNELTKSAGKSKDFFSQRPNDRVKSIKPGAIRRRVISANQNFNFGRTVQFRIPAVKYLGDCYLKVKLGASNVNYRKRCGANLLESFRLRNSGRLIQEHLNYASVYKTFQNSLETEKVNQMDKIIGQNNQNAQEIIIPLFCFWSSWCNPNLQRAQPFQYGKLKGNEGLVVDITINPVEAVTEQSQTPTAPNDLIESCELVFFEWITDSSLESAHANEQYVYHGHDYKTRSNIAMVAGQDKEVDVTALTGHTKYYFVSADNDDEKLQDDKTQNIALDKMALQIDGREYQTVNSSVENRADALIWAEK